MSYRSISWKGSAGGNQKKLSIQRNVYVFVIFGKVKFCMSARLLPRVAQAPLASILDFLVI